jgi:hypothetical protein
VTAIALALLLAAPGAGEDVAPSWPTDRPVYRSHLVPVLETIAFNFGLFTFNTLVSREKFSLISFDYISGHFTRENGWFFDFDYFLTNNFGHPYQGSFTFAAARSSGVSFWPACLYPFFASLAWEYFFERDRPSVNDQITSSLGGIFLGEALYRSSRFLTDVEGNPGFWRNLFAFLLSPMTALNRWLSDDRFEPGDVDVVAPFYAYFNPGVSLLSRLIRRSTDAPTTLENTGVQAVISGHLIYGAPGDPTWEYRYPFSHFDLSAQIAFPGVPIASLYVRGLLVGRHYGRVGERMQGLWGLFGVYDFAANNILRVSSVGLGLGTTSQIRLQRSWFLEGTLLLGGIGFGAAGSLGLDPNLLATDYHIGPGAQAILELRLVALRWGTLGFRARHWLVTGGYLPERQGFEAITYLTADLQVRIWSRLAVGLEVPFAFRVYTFNSGTNSIGSNGARVTISYASDDDFGVNGPIP